MTLFNELDGRLWIIHTTQAVLKAMSWRFKVTDRYDGSTGRISLANIPPFCRDWFGDFGLENEKEDFVSFRGGRGVEVCGGKRREKMRD